MGVLVCSANSSHTWNDRLEFIKLKPMMEFKVAAPQFAPQTNHVKMTVLVPLGVSEKLKERFASNLDQTVAGFLEMASEGDTILLSQPRLKALKQLTNLAPKTEAELFGMIYMLHQQANDAKEAARVTEEQLKAYEGTSPGTVVLHLGDNYGQAMQRARDSEPPLPLKAWCDRMFANAIENGWF
jgi:hypothetical protein